MSDHETTSTGLPSSEEAVSSPDVSLPGYRLHRLEVFNWGTFDGVVHSLVLDGQTTLLVGQNGAGKSAHSERLTQSCRC